MVVDLCLSEKGFDNLAGQELVAPPLLRSEALSVLHEMRWRAEIADDVADIALDRLDGAPIRREDPEGLVRAAWRLEDR